MQWESWVFSSNMPASFSQLLSVRRGKEGVNCLEMMGLQLPRSKGVPIGLAFPSTADAPHVLNAKVCISFTLALQRSH